MFKCYLTCPKYYFFSDTQPIKLPEVKKVLIFSFRCKLIALEILFKSLFVYLFIFLVPPLKTFTTEEMEKMVPLLQLVFYSIDKVKRFRLSREGKLKAEKNRQKVEELFLKTTHAQRQEIAQMKREEKKRAEKERMLLEEDPEKLKKWEEKEYKKELKKKAPKMKQLKVKAM